MYAALAAKSGSSVTPGDIIVLFAILVTVGLFFVWWKKAMFGEKGKNLGPIPALILTLLPLIAGILVGTLPQVAHQLYHLSGGKIGF